MVIDSQIVLFNLHYRELPPHPNVVQMFGVCIDGPQSILVLEYCAGGTNNSITMTICSQK
jgi:hypothetical protein